MMQQQFCVIHTAARSGKHHSALHNTSIRPSWFHKRLCTPEINQMLCIEIKSANPLDWYAVAVHAQIVGLA